MRNLRWMMVALLALGLVFRAAYAGQDDTAPSDAAAVSSQPTSPAANATEANRTAPAPALAPAPAPAPAAAAAAAAVAAAPAVNPEPAKPVANAAAGAGTTPAPADADSLALGILSLLILGGLTVWLGNASDMLRDSQPTDFGGAQPPTGVYRRPYSLAQTQMMLWFCIILGSYLYIAFATSRIAGILNEQSLILMGIGVGTALGASVIEQMKSKDFVTLNTFNDVVAQIKALPPGTPAPQALLAQRDKLAQQLASENFFRDIVTDVDGVSLHRFQSVGWTVVLGAAFLIFVLAQRKFPEFDKYLLAVLGISGGTYLGFKIPERPA